MSDATATRGRTRRPRPGGVVRSKAYLSALVLAALLGIPISAVAYGFLALVSWMQGYLFGDLPGLAVRRWRAGLVAGPVADALRAARRAHPAVPARPRGALAGAGLPDGRRATGRPPPARSRPRLARDAEPRCGARPRGTAHRHRRRARGPHRAPGQEGRPADGGDDHGLRRQLRRDQHAPRLAPARAPSSSWRRPASQGRPSPWSRFPACSPSGIGRPGLPRPRRVDRPGHLLAGADDGARRASTPRWRACSGRCRSASSARCSAGRSAGSA